MDYESPPLSQPVVLEDGYSPPSLNTQVTVCGEPLPAAAAVSAGPLGQSSARAESLSATVAIAETFSPLGESGARGVSVPALVAIAASSSPLGVSSAICAAHQAPSDNAAVAATGSPLGLSEGLASYEAGDTGDGGDYAGSGGEGPTLPDPGGLGDIEDLVNNGLGLVVIPPIEVLDADVIFFSGDEIEIPAWSSTVCYSVGDIVSHDGTTWRALHAVAPSTYRSCATMYNIGREPGAAYIPESLCVREGHGEPWWVEAVGADSNKMAMFSPFLEYRTKAQDTLDVTLKPTEKFDAIGLFGLVASSVHVVLLGSDGSTAYENTVDLTYNPQLYPTVRYKDSWVELELPRYDPADYGAVEAPLQLTFYGVGPNLTEATGAIKVGFVCLGQKRGLGLDAYETEVGIRDYSKKDRDVFGLPILKEDLYSYTTTYRFEALMEDLERIDVILADLRATVCAYVGCSWLPETHILGWYENYTIPLSHFSLSESVLEVVSTPIGETTVGDQCPTYAGKTIFACDGVNVASDCFDDTPLDDGVPGACQEKTVETVCGNLPSPVTGAASDSSGNVVEVGLNGNLFYNNERTPFSPWYNANARDVAWGFGVWIIVGDDGLISRSEDGYTWKTVQSPYYDEETGFDVNYTHVVISTTFSSSTKEMIVAFSNCLAKAFSWDGGLTFEKLEDISTLVSADGNLFDGVNGLSEQNRHKVVIENMTCYAYNDGRYLMAGGRTIHFTTVGTVLWQTRTDYATFAEGEAIIDCAASTAASRKYVFISKDRIVRCSEDPDTFTELLNPFSSDLCSVDYVNGSFFVSSIGGEIADIGSATETLSVKSGPEPACMGTLSPMHIWDIGYSNFNNGVPMA